MFSILEQHAAIAWDFDQTLIENPLSPQFHEFIRSTPEKRHVIVTFRTGGMLDTIFEELSEYPNAPENFTNIFSIDYDIWVANVLADILQQPGQPLHDDQLRYRSWKGMICAKHGLTIMVDDDTENALPGCIEHGIVFVNSLDGTITD